jgi:carbon starvation protein
VRLGNRNVPLDDLEKELDKEWNELIASGAVRAPGAAHTHTDRAHHHDE